ncbi:MAG TPA: lipoprotein insertase outer membrane protein LolB [Burkholderiales bacterium]|nr:lipoprotein insertase outer membrane protein LolB [Burkholderiales bacterium]
MSCGEPCAGSSNNDLHPLPVLRPFLRYRCAVLVVVLLAGCATLPPPQPVDLTAVGDFDLAGRIAVRVEDRGYSARMRWQHRIAGDEVWLYTPVGSVLATLTVDETGATLTTSDRKTFRSHDVQALTREVLGWDLPLDGLQHWVMGRVDPRAPVDSAERDERQRLTRLAQRDWTIDYLAYAADGALPSLLSLQYDELRLRLVIDRWQSASK